MHQNAFPFLVGMKYDHFTTFSPEEQEDITKQVRIAATDSLPVYGTY